MDGSQYRSSLRDGRAVYYQGKQVKVDELPKLARTIDVIAATYDKFAEHTADGGKGNPLLMRPMTEEELAARLPLLQAEDKTLRATYLSLMALSTAADRIEADFPVGAENARRYVEMVRERDLRVVQCISDSKGHRALSPGKQPDPDQYVRVVERRPDGIVIRGAKAHITHSALGHEMLVMPTKRMKADEVEYAVSCGVPVNAPGVKIVMAMPEVEPTVDVRDHPISADEMYPEGFVIFDDVFVPNDRIFLEGQVEHSAAFAHSLGLWERLGATSGQVAKAEQLVGLAQLIAEANGTEKISHIREKITDMILHAVTVRACLSAALANSRRAPDGSLLPDQLYVNAAKVHASTNWATMVRLLHDIAGGAVITVPSMADFDHEDLRDLLPKYFAGSSLDNGRFRAQLFHLLRNLTADANGGWNAVKTVQAGGGIQAQRIVMRNAFPMDRVKSEALQLMAGVMDEAPGAQLEPAG